MLRLNGLILSGFEVYAPPEAPPSVHEHAAFGRKSPFRAWPADARTRALRLLAEMLSPPVLGGRAR